MPHVVPDFQSNLAGLQERLVTGVTPGVIEETRQQLEAVLGEWGDSVSNHLKTTAAEVGEILLAVAVATESVGLRDQKYASRLTEMTTNLRTIADLGDIAKIRPMLLASAAELKNEISMMEVEGRESMSKLRAEISSYRTRLKESERRETQDALTGLRNRRGIEPAISGRCERDDAFSVILMDLNGFKEVNDVHGHLAGDDLMKQFAAELSTHFRSADVVGRWGGDEFVVITDCEFSEAMAYSERIRKWAYGTYTIAGAKGPVQIALTAAMGVATWNKKESAGDLLARVDELMYQDKKMSVTRS